jgi:hypothetical protein
MDCFEEVVQVVAKFQQQIREQAEGSKRSGPFLFQVGNRVGNQNPLCNPGLALLCCKVFLGAVL